MPVADLKIIYTENIPLQIKEWNELARKCSNIWQCTFYDEVQLQFNNHAIYFQCYHNEKLIGGVKLYLYQSRKLPGFIRAISSRVNQISEVMFEQNSQIEYSILFNCLKTEIVKWLHEKGIASFYQYSFYGEKEKLIQLDNYFPIWESKIAIAQIDLTLSEDDLWDNIHPKHRSEVIKGVKNNLEFVIENNFDAFSELLNETYKTQLIEKPHEKFLRKEYEVLFRNNSAQLAFAKHNGKYICGAFLCNNGFKSLYSFAGTNRNNLGAGQFLHWEIIKHLKKNNFQFYLLGETALEKDEENIKFSEGITKFKIRFGATQLPTFSRGYNLKPASVWFWNLLKKIFIH